MYFSGAMKTILITGATGLVGQEIVEQCFAQNIAVNYLSTSKSKLENKPIVDIWCLDLLETLNNFFNVKISSPKVFSQYCTFDIDNAYAFKNKGIFRYTASFLKDIMST